jgi:ABC-type multidrug transport system fused ATPase/permease subunit
VVLSFLSAMANGIIFPAFSLFLGQMIAELVSPAPSMARINNLALYFLLLSFGAFLVNFGQFSFFNVIGEKMTMRVRIELF